MTLSDKTIGAIGGLLSLCGTLTIIVTNFDQVRTDLAVLNNTMAGSEKRLAEVETGRKADTEFKADLRVRLETIRGELRGLRADLGRRADAGDHRPALAVGE